MMLAAFILERRSEGAVPRFRDPASILPLLWPMYLIHQFEEHGVDLLGRRYAFLGDLCAVLGHGSDPGGCPADPAFIFAVNGVGCQIAFALALAFRKRRPLIAACAWGIPLVNAVTHLGSAVARGAYVKLEGGEYCSAEAFWRLWAKRRPQAVVLGGGAAESGGGGVDAGARLSPGWRHFRVERNGEGKGPPIAAGFGLRVTFTEPVVGPIALGYAAHFGLGLLRPSSQ